MLETYQEMIDTVVATYDKFKEVVGKVEPDAQRLYLIDDTLKRLCRDYQDISKGIEDSMKCVGDSYRRIIHKILYADRWEPCDDPTQFYDYKYDMGEYKNLIACVILDIERADAQAVAEADSANIYGSIDSYLYCLGSKPSCNIPVIVGFNGLTTMT